MTRREKLQGQGQDAVETEISGNGVPDNNHIQEPSNLPKKEEKKDAS